MKVYINNNNVYYVFNQTNVFAYVTIVNDLKKILIKRPGKSKRV